MKQRLWLTLSIFLLLLAMAVPVNAQSGRAIFNWIIANKLLVQDGGLTVSGDTALADTTVTGTGSVTGDVTLGADLDMTPQTAISVTNGATITPTGAYQPLTSAGNVGFGAIAAGTAGQLLILSNNSNTTITITDTGTLKLSGNVALGQYDSVTLMSDGTNWRQLATSNN